ncbi:MAG: lysophospholipid acyltransferase family protein [Chloroflexi bacterium]|nr:lysophospholipid acyltransferase family protein [Chloroflexota bacterium]
MSKEIRYPRRRVIRTILKNGIALAFGVLAKFEIEGQENIPSKGPLLVVANHFHFLDPLALIHTSPWPVEFVGGSQTPNSPSTVSWFAKAFGVIPTFRGTGSRETLQTAEAILKQNGVLAIFPEGGSWANVLRPARPGTAFLAWRTNAQILPIGLDGFLGFFQRIKLGNRTPVKVKFGKPFGPVTGANGSRPGREELDEIGHNIMRNIAVLLPPERQGFYSPDPAIREAARGTEIYPWENISER